jgi:hypothetical protein
LPSPQYKKLRSRRQIIPSLLRQIRFLQRLSEHGSRIAVCRAPAKPSEGGDGQAAR